MNSVEIWRDLPGYGGHYAVSNRGRVRSKGVTIVRPHSISGKMTTHCYQSRILAQRVNRKGELCVTVGLTGQQSTLPVHRAVELAFDASTAREFMPQGARRMTEETRLLADEEAGRSALRKACRGRGAQAELCARSGIDRGALSRMISGETGITLEAALALDIATAGALAAETLCPSRAHLLAALLRQRYP